MKSSEIALASIASHAKKDNVTISDGVARKLREVLAECGADHDFDMGQEPRQILHCSHFSLGMFNVSAKLQKKRLQDC